MLAFKRCGFCYVVIQNGEFCSMSCRDHHESNPRIQRQSIENISPWDDEEEVTEPYRQMDKSQLN